MMCGKCGKITGILLLVLGIIYLVADLSGWNFFGIQWYTSLFLLLGVMSLGSAHCRECNVSGKKK